MEVASSLGQTRSGPWLGGGGDWLSKCSLISKSYLGIISKILKCTTNAARILGNHHIVIDCIFYIYVLKLYKVHTKII